MGDFLARTRILFGDERLKKIQESKIVIFGLGGVGSYAAEALVRSGVENFLLIDYDTINISNLNRQLIATLDTIGQYKVDAMEDRMRLINPNIKAEKHPDRVDEHNVFNYIADDVDYVVDAIDDIWGKRAIINYCYEKEIKLISSMATGNRFAFRDYEFSDIEKTHGCPLARKLRRQLRKDGIYKGVEVLYSPYPPDISVSDRNIGSVAHVPGQGGLKLAEKVINNLANA